MKEVQIVCLLAATKLEYAKCSSTEGMRKIDEKYEIEKISLSTLKNIERDETYLMPVSMKGHIQYAPLSKVNTEQQSKPASQKRLLKEKYITGPFIRGKIRRVLHKTRTVPFIRVCLI